MKRWTAIAALAAVLGAINTAPAQATASLNVNGSGQLTGATGVMVNGASYNVSFADGTCGGFFGGCDNSNDFVFQSEADATAAAQALLDQVFIDGAAGSFDTLPGKTNGCAGAESFCDALIPYAIDTSNPDLVLLTAAVNAATEASDDTISAAFGTQADTSANPGLTWAIFTPVSSVPEASSWVMLLLGFAGIGFAVRQGSEHRRTLA